MQKNKTITRKQKRDIREFMRKFGVPNDVAEYYVLQKYIDLIQPNVSEPKK